MPVQSLQTPKGNSLHKNASYDVQIIKIGPSIFAQLMIYPNPNFVCLASHPKCALPVGHLNPM